jgi:phosphatidylglycerol:prolipoprotein diacylglycerol transferase
MSLNFPNIDPVILEIGPFVIRWYALAYIIGLFGGLKYVEILLYKRPSPLLKNFNKLSVENLFTYTALGVILGGRIGYVLFYKPSYYLINPIDILKVWQGGMSFHGGLLGVIIGILIFSYRNKFNPLAIGDYICTAVPIGLFFGRIANFINAELYGRVTDVPWAIRFPTISGLTSPRHPSQLYEAVTEGLILFLILHFILYKTDNIQKKGYITGVFFTGYAISRIFCEFFREPDDFLGFIITLNGGGLTQGMILSVPMLIIGLYFLITAKKINQ